MEFTRITERNVKEKIEYLRSLEEIVLEEESIASNSLDECVNVRRITIGKRVKDLPAYLFEHCHKIEAVQVEEGNECFALAGDCLVERSTGKIVLCYGEPHIPEVVRELDFSCFIKTDRVEEFTIGKSVEKITNNQKCFSIGTIVLNPENTYFELEGNCLFYAGGDKVILGSESSVIPSRAKHIGSLAFAGSGIKKISVPPSVETIDISAFENCRQLERVDFAEGLTEIDDYAFMHCESLREIAFPKSLKTAGECTFCGCKSLKKADFGTLTALKRWCFARSGLESVTIPGTIKTVGTYAFGECSKLREVTLEAGVEKLGDDAFANCVSLIKVTMADTVTELGESAFEQCGKLTDVSLSAGITVLPFKCFYECKSLVEIKLPAGLKSIESYAFHSCGKLETVNWSELPKLKKIIKDAFTGCRKLKENPAAKKTMKLPKKLYSMSSYEEIIAENKPGESIVLMRESLAELVVKYQRAFEYEGAKYLYVLKKADRYMIEVSDELKLDDDIGVYEVYTCRVIDEADKRFAALLQAAEQ